MLLPLPELLEALTNWSVICFLEERRDLRTAWCDTPYKTASVLVLASKK